MNSYIQKHLEHILILSSMCINFCFDHCIKFPVAVLTNHCKLRDLRQHKLISQFWRSEIQNQLHWAKAEVWTGLAAFVERRIQLFPCLFQFLEAIFIPWLMVPSSHCSKLLTLKMTKNHFKNQYLLYIPTASQIFQIFLQNKMATIKNSEHLPQQKLLIPYSSQWCLHTPKVKSSSECM